MNVNRCVMYNMYWFNVEYNLKEEEKNIRDELEKLKLKYIEMENKNKQLIQNLNAAMSQIQNLKVS